MRSTPLSQLISTSFENELSRPGALPGRLGEPLLAELSGHKLARLMHDPAVPLARQDAVLAAVIRCYRRTPDPSWSALLLEMLAPMLVSACSRLFFIPQGVEEEDLHDQLVMVTLHTARAMALPEPPRDVQRRIRRRVLRATAGWLVGVIRSQCESLEEVEAAGSEHRDRDQLFLQELRGSGVSSETLDLLYRVQVLGVTARELAVEMGISADAVRKRMRRALRQLRQSAPARFRRFVDDIPTAA